MAKLTYTGAEVQSLLDKVNGISGGGIAYPLSWSGYSSGVYDGSAPANIEIPSLVSQLTNDSDYITTASVNSLLTDYLSKSGGTVDGKIFYGGGRISGDVKLTSMVVDDNANSGKIIFAGANYDYGDNDYKMGPYIQGINLTGWGKKKISFFQRDYSVEGCNADPVEVFSVMPDGEIQLNGTIHFTKEVPMIKMVENGWAQSKVMWHGWDSTEGDSLWLQIPSGVENNVYFKLCRLAPSILNTSLQVNGNFLVTGEVTQHSSLELKDVVGTRFLTLKELAELKPYSFYWKDGRDDKLHAGAVADYVKPILSEVISTDKNDIHSMNYANAAWIVGTSLTPYVSKHEEEIERLKARVKYLESRLKEC